MKQQVRIQPYTYDDGTPFADSEDNVTEVAPDLLTQELARDGYSFVALEGDGTLTFYDEETQVWEEWTMRQEGEGTDNLEYTDCLGGFEFCCSYAFNPYE
jgi:hypothetical protein